MTETEHPKLRDARFRILPFAISMIVAATAIPVEIGTSPTSPLTWHVGLKDVLQNIVLYMPLGIALYRHGMLKCLLLAAVLTTTIESLQVIYPGRYSGAADVAANIFGAFAGYYVAALYPRRHGWLFIRLILRPRGGVLLVIIAVLFCFLVALPGTPHDFSNWDPSFELVVGDEPTRDRTWRGELLEFAVLPTFLDEKTLRDIDEQGFGSIAAFADTASGPVAFMSQPNLDEIRGRPLFDRQETRSFFDRATRDQNLTILFRMIPGDIRRDSATRIVTFSPNPFMCNFMVAQQLRQIVFRLRTPVTGASGTLPQASTLKILEADKEYFVAATYDGMNSRIYVNGSIHTRLSLAAQGRLVPFLSDIGLPAASIFIGMVLSTALIAMTRRRTPLTVWILAPLFGLLGTSSFAFMGGADALPSFTLWIPVLGFCGSMVVAASTVR